MTNKQDRWERHMADEARVIDAQQVSAGNEHSPVRGPAPHGDFAMNAVAGDAAAQARLRCAGMLQELIEACRGRGETSMSLAQAEALAARMRQEDPP